MVKYVHDTPEIYSYRRRLQRPRKQKGIIRESLLTVSKEYCAESSICGLKHLVARDTTVLERTLWVVILIVGLGCSISLVHITFVNFYRAPLVTTQMPEGVSVSKIIFPAVGICSSNRISRRAVMKLAKALVKEERNRAYSEKDMMNLLTGLGDLYDLQPGNVDHGEHMELHKALGSYDVYELLKSLTPPCEDLLVRCVWNNEIKHCLELFDVRLTVNGYCCTFNFLRFSDTKFTNNETTRNVDSYQYGNKSTFDFDQGLKVMLRLNESDDFYYNIPVLGAQLQFSDAYDFPDAPSGSFSMQIVNPGVRMSVLVSASFTEASRDIQHVDLSLRKCRFYDESSYLTYYTYSDCMLKCRMNFLLKNCNCTPFTMPKEGNARTCDMRDIGCLRIFYVQSINVRPNVDAKLLEELELDLVGGGIDCPECSPTCSKTAYSYDVNNVNINENHMNEASEEKLEDWLRGVNFTGASLVHVKYAKEVADRYGRNVIMKWFDLISNIGSTCGFVTGFSFLSVLEFVYFFTVKFFREIQSRRQPKLWPEQKGISSIEAVSRLRPIYWNELTQSTGYSNFPRDNLH